MGERYHGRISLDYLDSNGNNISRDGDEDDGYRNATLNFTGGVDVAEGVDFGLSARVLDTESETDNDFSSGLPADSDGVSDTFQSYLGAHLSFTGYDGLWTSRISGAWTKVDNRDLDLANAVDSRRVGEKRSVDLQTTMRWHQPSLFDAMHRLTLALDYESQDFKQRGPATIFGDPNQVRAQETTGYIAEFRSELRATGTSLGASIRKDDNDSFKDVTTYRVAVIQSIPATGTVVTAAYAEGQKSPTFFDLFGFSSGGFVPFVGNPSLSPENSTGWEVNLKQGFAGDALLLDLTYFNERLRDEIDGFFFDAANFTLTAVNRPGTSHRRGIEMAITAFPLSDLSLSGTYTYLDANQIDANTGLRRDEIRRARHSGGAEINYRFAGGRGNLNFHVARSWTPGRRYIPAALVRARARRARWFHPREHRCFVGFPARGRRFRPG